jgi:hypothetical protein
VVRLREWASERGHDLPDPPVAWKLGSASSCELQLDDTSGLMSREHALLAPSERGWRLRDLQSKNGLWCDGVRRLAFWLRPGIAIKIGRLCLVAESVGLAALRAVVCRYLGWAPERQGEVDDALYSLRDCAALRSTLVVIGDGDLTPVAARLHGLTLGSRAPFTVYAPGEDPAAIIHGAALGTLCVAMRRRADAAEVLNKLSEMKPAARPRIVLCASSATEVADLSLKLGRLAMLSLPPLAMRADELERIIQASATDATQALGAPATGFTMHDLERLRAIEFRSFAEIEETVRRIVAMRTWGVTAGAARLGITHASLSTWARRSHRRLST